MKKNLKRLYNRFKYLLQLSSPAEENPDFIPADNENLNRGKCPDCSGQLFAGPRGGIAVNVECQDCGHKFNMLGPFGAERIGDV